MKPRVNDPTVVARALGYPPQPPCVSGKRCHRTKREAEKHRSDLVQALPPWSIGRPGRGLVVYLCEHCPSWHVGTSRRESMERTP